MRSCTVRLRTWTLPPGTTPPLPEIAAYVQRAFQRAGYSVRPVEAASLRYARLVLRLPGSGEELEMDLFKEALEPRWVTVQITPAASVRAVSLEDTVGLKARAWHDRFVIRDIIDLHAVAGTFSYADSHMPTLRTLPAAMIRTSTWRQSGTISPGSASSPTKTSRNTGLMSGESRTCATGPQAGTTTSPSVSPRTLPTMKFRMTYDQYTRHEADSLFQEPGGQCVSLSFARRTVVTLTIRPRRHAHGRL